MTRIVAGSWKGHPLPVLRTGQVRPTTDRARTVLFDTLGDIRNSHVLDLYSGTGALGFEALSRGATYLHSIDMDRRYIEEQRSWAEKHDLGNHFKASCARLPLVLTRIDEEFDIILADPPYHEPLDSKVSDFIESHLKPGGTFIYERGRRDTEELVSHRLLKFKQKVVADTLIQFYKADQI